MPEAQVLDPRIVANFVLARAREEGLTLTNLDVQKIVYFLHGASLRHRGLPLVQGHFEAWQYGPVHRVLYDAFRAHKDAPIDQPAQRFDPIRRQHHPLPPIQDSALISFLDTNLDRYLLVPTFMLVQFTHAPGTPWSRTMEAAQGRANVGMIIDDDLIVRHFEGDDIGTRSAGRQTGQRRVTPAA